jgi:hypothetical protein
VSNTIRIFAIALTFLAMSGCAHKDLTAPCGFDNDGIFGSLWPTASAFACEQMRPINREQP